MKVLFSITLLLLTIPFYGQDKKETNTYFDFIKEIVSTERFGDRLVNRLDTLKSKFIPSRSHVNDYFNRDIEFGFKHRRIGMSLNFSGFQIDLLTYNDTIFLSSTTAIDYKSINYENYNEEVVGRFLKKRNEFYNSSKTTTQLIKEISFAEEYAFYCGDGNPKTKRGKYIGQLVEEESTDTFIDMLKSFNCEIQAYGVAGFNMLAKKDYEIPFNIQQLIQHIKKRNAEIVTCSGCETGLIDKIYSK